MYMYVRVCLSVSGGLVSYNDTEKKKPTRTTTTTTAAVATATHKNECLTECKIQSLSYVVCAHMKCDCVKHEHVHQNVTYIYIYI